MQGDRYRIITRSSKPRVYHILGTRPSENPKEDLGLGRSLLSGMYGI